MISIDQILIKLPSLRCVGNTSRKITEVVSANSQHFSSSTLTWISDKNQDLLKSINDGAVICSELVPQEKFHAACSYIIVANPRSYFSQVIHTFFYEEDPEGISIHSHIHPSVKIGEHPTIKEGVVIEKNCGIGKNISIGCNTVIGKNIIIGNNVKIGANCTLGGTGFGYEKDGDGSYVLIPHIGNVVIEDGVEIGNNTAIDRAVLGSTLLKRNCKIDNLVHIAHGVEIGENALIIAHAMIGGSTTIGKDVWFAPAASVLNKISIGEGALIGMGAVVLKNVSPGKVIVGNPGKEMNPTKS